MSINIFFPPRYERFASVQIRAKQIGDFIGARIQSEEVSETDTCIYVVTVPREKVSKNVYLDILDREDMLRRAKRYPWYKVIAMSNLAKEHISDRLGRNDIIVIPNHHCNFERFVKPMKEIETVGCVGNKHSLQCDVNIIKNLLSKIEVKFIFFREYRNRMDVVGFYKNIDLQVVFRPSEDSAKFKSPLKLQNAGSFGIPTIAYPEYVYQNEWDGCFEPANTVEELVEKVKWFKENNDVYGQMRDKGIRRAEETHIENVAKLYRSLDN